MLDKWPWWLQVLVGVLLTLAGIEGLAEDDQVWGLLLSLVVTAAGLSNIGYGIQRKRQ